MSQDSNNNVKKQPVLDDKEKNDEEAVEHISDVIGQFGPMQMRIMTYLILIYIISPFNWSEVVFTAPKGDFFCIDRDEYGNQVNLTNSCTVGNSSQVCQVFDYDRSFHEKTLVNTFDLVCEKSWYASLAQSLHQLGFAVSGLLLGIISDRKGRFFCAKLSIVLEIIAGFGEAFAPNIYYYFVARFLIGFASYGRFLNGYVLIAEWVGPKIRGRMAALYDVGWCFGDLTIAWVYYFVPNYVKVHTAIAVLESCLLIGYVFVVKESPRWQLTHGRFEEAEATLKEAALEKGVYSESEIDRRIKKLKEFTLKEQEIIEKQQLDKTSILDVWKDKRLLKTSLILYFSWFSVALVAYGAFLNIGNLGGSLHVNVFLNAISGVISTGVLYFIIRKFERRQLMRWILGMKALLLLFLLSCSFHDALIPFRIFFFNVSGIAGWLEYGVIYVYTTEFFPTTMRQTSLGICSIFARVGSMIAPFIKELTLATHLAVPFILFIVLALTSSLLWMLLPNTTDIELPDSIFHSKKVEEEEIKRRRSSTPRFIQAIN